MKKKNAQSGETRNMDILIDSNVIIDWISRRSEFYEDSKKIIDICFFGNINAFVTAHSLCDIYYILRKDSSALSVKAVTPAGFLSLSA